MYKAETRTSVPTMTEVFIVRLNWHNPRDPENLKGSHHAHLNGIFDNPGKAAPPV